jgi:hypothetical protein
MSVATLQQIPELVIEDTNEFFARARFRSVPVDLLLTRNPFFKLVGEKFATQHRFAELDVPAVTVEGLIVLKLYALPSLYRQMDLDCAALYETDITLLIASVKGLVNKCQCPWISASSSPVATKKGICANSSKPFARRWNR